MLQALNRVRAYDARSLSTVLEGWLSPAFEAEYGVEPMFDRGRGWNTGLRAVRNRGFQNVITGSLLCPIFLDYGNESYVFGYTCRSVFNTRTLIGFCLAQCEKSSRR